MDASSVTTIRSALNAYQPGDLLALSDLHEALTRAVAQNPDSPAALDLAGCAATIESQLAGGSYDLEDLFFENLLRILTPWETPGTELPPPQAPVAAPAEPAANPEYVQTFCVELAERLATAQDLILKLEAGQASADDRVVLFRLFHTIKGEAGFLKLATVLELFHHLEGLLDGLRRNTIPVTPGLVDRLFEGVDLAEKARGLLLEGRSPEGLAPAVSRLALGIEAVLQGHAPTVPAPAAEGPKPEAGPSRSEENLVKVSGAKLSYLVDMVGEMLILQNQMADDTKEAQMLRKVSREVQQAAMSLRTVHLKPLFTKMQRAVRDVSRQLDKPVSVVLQGETNEIDRTLVEAMEEPLVHLVRNCIGHGIEPAAVRKQAGKPAEGRVVLTAERRGNHVILGIEDDGQGLDAPAILRKAVENGVVSPQDAGALSEDQIHELIFRDGLSTAETVDDISGRGVGMSIVKKTVDRFRGHIHIRTARGQGTRFDLVFPLSMAILDGMIIELSQEKYILPVENVFEAVRIQPDMLVDVTGGGQVFRLRGDVLPVVDLAAFFYGQRPHPAEVAVLVENNQHDRFAVLVEKVLEKREVVIKSLGHRFQNLVGISAAAILRGGEIGYLIDIDAITGGSK